ncbi:MAG: alpha/beta hydrolase [Azoarcus sp.]|jgi:alpha/beta superfamily hydrolase|nr:alpha/beta hydrolase [Azoarcus sp.]
MTAIRSHSPEHILIPGAAGNIDMLADIPGDVRGIALVCHPHPLFGGANTNKVAYTLARALRDLGYAALRPNFRGVGKSEGTHDFGNGETQDMLTVLAWAQTRWGKGLPLVLGGFSFGAYVQVRLAGHLATEGFLPRQMVLVGTAVGKTDGSSTYYETPPVPKNIPALIIHGESDETVPLGNVLEWARRQELSVTVISGVDHFFHGRLNTIRELVARNVLPAAVR